MIRMSPLEVEVNRLNVNFIRTNNEKIELVVVLIILGILGLHYTFIAQPQETPKDQMKKNQINNNSKTNYNEYNKQIRISSAALFL